MDKIFFSFVTVAFNQENYVVEHLNSIKNLIEKYGGKKSFEIIFCDDCSNDNTFDKAEKWIFDNTNLFVKTTIYRQKTNVGTVKNMFYGVNIATGENIKVLACDDKYSDSNIFNICGKYDVLITPIIPFTTNDGIDKRATLDSYFLRMLLAKNIKKTVKKMINYNQIINAPGVFLSNKILKNEGMQKFVGKYKYIEDWPSWFYISNYMIDEISINVVSKPLVMYRKDSGVTKHLCNSTNVIGIERTKLIKDIKPKAYIIPSYINPYTYIDGIENIIVRFNKSCEKERALNEYNAELERQINYEQEIVNNNSII